MSLSYICAVDIGSSKISAAVAEIRRRHITNIFFETVPSKGIERGIIINSIDLIGSIGRLLKNLKAKSCINIKFIYTNISGKDIITKHSNAIIPLAERGNKVITVSDIKQINEQARILGLSLDEEIIHQIPFSYSIDSKKDISNPLGLYSHKLEIDLYLIYGKLSSIQSLTRVVNQAGYEIKDLFFSGIVTSKAIFNKELKEGINIICDIGSDITELLVFSNGVLKNIEILPIGGNDLTLQLQETLKIPFDLAEDLKRTYGVIADYSQLSQDKEILLKKNNIYKSIKQRLISEILTAKTELICRTIKGSLDEMVSCERLDNFVTTGRTVLLEGFLEILEKTLGISAKLGRINNPDIISLVNKNDTLSGSKYLTYLTALGIICEVLHFNPTQSFSTTIHSPTRNPILKAVNRIKEVYQEYF